MVIILFSASGLFYPAVSSTFGPYYGSIAKHIVTSGDWNNLILSQHDWLDKPHLPFWVTAFCFKLFGINGFAFAISGFIFSIIGAIYTYKLAKLLYNIDIARVALLFYLTTLHLMLSAIDVRAEAYLLGEIMPASYYSMCYYRYNKIRYALFTAIFIALSLMTKGLFTLITICSGIVVLWIYKRDWRRFVDYRWFLIIIIGLVLTFPEILALYKQFDTHPEKIIFGRYNTSGIKWFFFDSQFGRFFNTGPIMSSNPVPLHWLYFVHTFLWAFLPWWPIFFLAIANQIKNYKNITENNIYLWASFFITFILFSATTFQVDHYTNIIFPFAIIICASFLVNNPNQIIQYIMCFIAIIFCILIVILLTILPVQLMLLYIISILVVLYGYSKLTQNRLEKIIYFPITLIVILFSIIMFINGNIYAKYDAGYQAAIYLNKLKNINVIGYNIDRLSIDLYSKNNYSLITDNNLLEKNFTGYIFTKDEYYSDLNKLYKNIFIVSDLFDCSIDKVVIRKITQNNDFNDCQRYIIIKVN
jgi:4-amino-4-deoxy-L-arabinose transferase-like glycosyltransferase